MTKTFINLTNGLEAIPELLKEGIDINFVRIQSTTLERKNWRKLFADLDHNFLINLIIGNDCMFYDYGTNRKYSKTIYQGVPIISYVLSKAWFAPDGHSENSSSPEAIRYTRNSLEPLPGDREYYNFIYNKIMIYPKSELELKAKEKINYYRKFISLNAKTTISLIPVGNSTCHDGDWAYYSEKLARYVRES